MKSARINLLRRFPLESLRCRMINLPKARGREIAMKRQGEGIEARPQDDDLGDSVLEPLAREEGEAFLSQRIMTNDSGHRVLLEKLQDTKKPRSASEPEK